MWWVTAMLAGGGGNAETFCVCVHVFVCIYEWRPEVNLRCHPLGTIHLGFETQRLIGPELASQAQLAGEPCEYFCLNHHSIRVLSVPSHLDFFLF